MDNAKIELADKLKAATNILVTVSRDPSVDQLAALLGLTLILNKFNKHAAAVFSGQVPSTIEFLKPEETFETNTDSLRDFIIAIDRSKADKLRYKLEDDVVRIFVTPYKTSISQADLEFSQGDFNVDVVVALGVLKQEDLDEAITTHGRILHDATITSINIMADGGLGSIAWHDPQASSLSELVTELGQVLDKDLLDQQIATALLTGIVAETERFSNHKTTSETMHASATLMAAGADQQLVASKLEEPEKPKAETKSSDDKGDDDSASKPAKGNKSPKPDDGTLEITHDGAETADKLEKDDSQSKETEPELALPEPVPDDGEVEDAGEQASEEETDEAKEENGLSNGSKLITEPPSLGGMLTANSRPEALDPVTDPLSMMNPDVAPQILNRDAPVEQKGETVEPPAEQKAEPASDTPLETPLPTVEPPQLPVQPIQPLQPLETVAQPPADWTPPAFDTPTPTPAVATPAPEVSPEPTPPATPEEGNKTLADLEKSVNAHQSDQTLGDARDEVSKALTGSVDAPVANQSINAQPLGDELHPQPPAGPGLPPMEQPVIDADPTAVPDSTSLGEHGDELSALNLNTDPTTPAEVQPAPQPQTEASKEGPAAEVNDPNAPPPVPPPFDPGQFSSVPTPPTDKPQQ
jgi:hypothetical protein